MVSHHDFLLKFIVLHPFSMVFLVSNHHLFTSAGRWGVWGLHAASDTARRNAQWSPGEPRPSGWLVDWCIICITLHNNTLIIWCIWYCMSKIIRSTLYNCMSKIYNWWWYIIVWYFLHICICTHIYIYICMYVYIYGIYLHLFCLWYFDSCDCIYIWIIGHVRPQICNVYLYSMVHEIIFPW